MTMSTYNTENREVVRTALEQVCARGDMALAPSCYAEDFVDHVGRLAHRGLEGVRRSTMLYQALLDDLASRSPTRSLMAIGWRHAFRNRVEPWPERRAAHSAGASRRTQLAEWVRSGVALASVTGTAKRNRMRAIDESRTA